MPDYNIITALIKEKASSFGFLEAAIASITIDPTAKTNFNLWLEQNFAGDMDYLKRNTDKRFNPELLHTGTLAIICVKVPYLQDSVASHKQRLLNPEQAYISSYALGRDYHKVVKQQLKRYCEWIDTLLSQQQLSQNYRVFTDSAPILEVQLAVQAGLGWRGKNTLLINKQQGSMFFLGEIFTNLPLPADTPSTNHCGSCHKCLDICPTKAFSAPYILDARKCISYLTIENQASIPLEFRKAIGNRVYGCDDCQLFCPWNKFSQLGKLTDFKVRNKLDASSLVELFAWSEEEFQQRLQGSPIYRIGYSAWRRNLAVGLGNAPYSLAVIQVLQQQLPLSNEMVAEHIAWALQEQSTKKITQLPS